MRISWQNLHDTSMKQSIYKSYEQKLDFDTFEWFFHLGHLLIKVITYTFYVLWAL